MKLIYLKLSSLRGSESKDSDPSQSFHLGKKVRLRRRQRPKLSFGLWLLAMTWCFATATVQANCLEAVKKLKAGTEMAKAIEQISSYRGAINLCPDLAEAYYNLGLVLRKEGKFLEARTNFEQAVKKGDNPVFKVALADSFLQEGGDKQAEKLYQELYEKEENNPYVLSGLAAIKLKQKNYTQAQEFIRAAIQQDSDNSKLYFNLALILEKLDKKEEALKAMQTATQKKNNFVQALLELARMHREQGDFSEALAALEKASVFDSENKQVAMAYARIYEKQDELELAKTMLEKVIQDHPADRNLALSLAILELKLEDAKGLERLQRLAKLYQKDSEIQAALGWAHLKQGELDLAEKILMQAVDLDDTNAFSHNNLGVLYELKGQQEQARKEFLRAKELAPELEQVERNLAKIDE